MLDQAILLLALASTLGVCVMADAIAIRFGVMAHPDQDRRKHAHPTPQVGGLAILCGLGVWLLARMALSLPDYEPIFLAMILSVIGLGTIGFVDDQHEISPLVRVFFLLLFSGIAFALDPQLISPVLHWNSMGNTAIPVILYLPLMGITVVGLVNAVNMTDGQNGIVGSMFVVWSGCLMIVSHGLSAQLAGMLCVLSAIFLIFNLRGKMFLGDCGSYGVTFAVGLLVILAHARGDVSLETLIVWFFIPVIDCLRLLITRPLQGRSPFAADRDHFHHRLQDSLGKNGSAAVYAGTVAATSLLATLQPRFSLLCVSALCAFYFSFAHVIEDITSARKKARTDGAKVVSITSKHKQG